MSDFFTIKNKVTNPWLDGWTREEKSAPEHGWCTRCGLYPSQDEGRKCASCVQEEAYLGGAERRRTSRKCPVCKSLMARDEEVLSCHDDDCDARFDIRTARLTFEGCDRVGKGVVGTNRMVKNDAQRIVAKRKQANQANQAEYERMFAAERGRILLHWQEHGELPEDGGYPDVLVDLILHHKDALLERAAFAQLSETRQTAHLFQIADSSSHWSSHAKSVLESWE